MKKIFVLFCFCIPMLVYCQSIDTTKGKFQLGLSFSPDYCYRTIKSKNEQWLVDVKDDLQSPKFGYTTGINLNYKFNNKIAFETGILFSDKGYKIKNHSLGNAIGGDLPATSSVVYHYYYFDIPLKANYYLQIGKIKYFLTAGVSTNILFNASSTSTLEYGNKFPEKNKSTLSEDVSRFNFAGMLGLGMECKLTEKSNFRIEPLYNRSLNSIIEAPVKEYLYSFGLNVGFCFKL